MTSIAAHESSFLSTGERLVRQSVLPENPWARLHVLHGYGDHSGRYRHFMTWMADCGVACQALDFRGHGRSSGKRAFVKRWEDYLEDFTAFLGSCEADSGASMTSFYLGHSHGGLVLAEALLQGRLPSESPCVFTSPYFGNALPIPRWKQLAARALNRFHPAWKVASGIDAESLSSDPEMVEDTRNDPLLLHLGTPRWFVETTRVQAHLRDRAAGIVAPLFMLCGGDDTIADVETSRRVFEKFRSPDKRFELYPGLRHELLRERERNRVFADLLAWMKNHVD